MKRFKILTSFCLSILVILAISKEVHASYILEVLSANGQNYTCEGGIIALEDRNMNKDDDEGEDIICIEDRDIDGSIEFIFLSGENTREVLDLYKEK